MKNYIVFIICMHFAICVSASQSVDVDLTSGGFTMYGTDLKAQKSGSQFEVVLDEPLGVANFILSQENKGKGKQFYILCDRDTIAKSDKAVVTAYTASSQFYFSPNKTYKIFWGDRQWIIKTFLHSCDLEIISDKKIKLFNKEISLVDESYFAIPDTSSRVINTIKIPNRLVGKEVQLFVDGKAFYKTKATRILDNLNMPLDPHSSYEICIDDKKYTLGSDDDDDDDDESSSFIFVVVLLSLFVICGMIFWRWKNKRKGNDPHKDVQQEGVSQQEPLDAEECKQVAPETEASPKEEGNEDIDENPKKEEDKVSLVSLINEDYLLFENLGDQNKVIEKIREIIHHYADNESLLQLINLIKEKLSCNELDILKQIDLLQSQSKLNNHENHGSTTSESAIIEYIENRISSKTNISKVWDEKCEGDFRAKIQSLFNILDSRIRPTQSISPKDVLVQYAEKAERGEFSIDERIALDRCVIYRLKNENLQAVNIQPNTSVKDLVQRINNLASISDTPLKSNAEIISDILEKERESEVIKNVITNYLVNEINKKLPDESKLKPSIKIEELYSRFADSVIVPQTDVEILEKGEKSALVAVGNALGHPVETTNVSELKEIFQDVFVNWLQTKFLNRLQINRQENEGIDEFFDTIKAILKDGKDVSQLTKKYNIDYVSDLENAIRKNEANSLVKAVQFPDSFSVDSCETIEQIVNKLIRLYAEENKSKIQAETDKRDSEILIMNALHEGFKKLSGKELSESDSVIKAYDEYDNQVTSIIEDAKVSLENEQKTNERLSGEINSKSRIIEDQSLIINAISSNIRENVTKAIDQLNVIINNGGYFKACDKTSKRLCEENEERMKAAMEKFILSSEAIVSDDDSPVKIKTAIQHFIELELRDNNSIINLIAHYYAYSRLAFMTDKNRQYGIYFDRKLLSELFFWLEKMLGDFGFQLVIPTLFSERLLEGPYENCTGKEYGDLDNICPQSVNYKENISNPDKSDIIIDVIQAGYIKDGEVVSKAKVII